MLGCAGLRFAVLCYAILRFTKFGYNYALLSFACLYLAPLYFTRLSQATLFCLYFFNLVSAIALTIGAYAVA